LLIYKATNLINGKEYIGKTTRKFRKRRSSHKTDAKQGRGAAIGRAIRKYGFENFRFEIICECFSRRELSMCERAQIAQHGTLAPRGYNLTSGGDGGCDRPRTAQERAAASERAKRDYAAGRLTGLNRRGTGHFGPEVHAQMSLSAMCRNRREGPLFVRSPGAARKSGESRAGKKRTPEQIERIKLGLRLARRLSKGDAGSMSSMVASGSSVRDVAVAFGISSSLVSRIVSGRHRLSR
jgi:group I intron endonuclease